MLGGRKMGKGVKAIKTGPGPSCWISKAQMQAETVVEKGRRDEPKRSRSRESQVERRKATGGGRDLRRGWLATAIFPQQFNVACFRLADPANQSG